MALPKPPGIAGVLGQYAALLNQFLAILGNGKVPAKHHTSLLAAYLGYLLQNFGLDGQGD